MRKQILTSTVSIFTVVLIAGLWPAESCAAEKLDLKLRLKPGQKYGMRLITEMKRMETMEGKQEHESFMFDRGMGFEVKEVDANGVALVEVTFQTLRMKVIRAGGYRMEYDSTKQSAADDYSKVPAIEAAGLGESFSIKISPKGEIIEVEGLEEMCLGMIEKVDEWDKKYLRLEMVPCRREETSGSGETGQSPVIMDWEKMSPSYKKVWREVRRHNIKESTYSEKEIRNMLSDMIMAFPDQPLEIGDSWTDKIKIWGKNEDIDGAYTLKDTKKGAVTVDLSARRTTEEEPFSWVNDEGREVGFKIVGSYEGNFEIDQKTSWLVRSKVKTRFTGKVIDKEANDQMTKPILMEEVITVEPVVLGD